MKLVYLCRRIRQKIRNKIGLALYLKRNRIEKLDMDLDESVLEGKWEFRNADCTGICIPTWETDELIDLSVIVPLYNSEKFIQTCVESFLDQQTKYCFEIILVNDGSKDQTLSLAKELQDKEPDRIRIIEQENQGISAARNAGIKIAKGRYISFVDHDDLVDASFVEKLMSAAYKEDADIVKAAFADIRNGKVQKPQEQSSVVVCGAMKERLFDYRSYIFPGVYKRELFARVSFPEEFWYEDMIVRTLLYRQTSKFVHISDVLYYKQFHATNASFVVWNLKNYKCLEHLYLVINIIKVNRQIGLPTDVWFYQCILHELSFILSLRVRGLDEKTKQMVFLKACAILKDLYKDEYAESLVEDKHIWQRVFMNKEYKLWLLLSGHYYL